MSADERGLVTRAIGRAFSASVPHPYPYLYLLDRIHQYLRPRTYAEVGVSKGLSLALVLPGTDAVGIDPAPQVSFPLRRGTQLFREQSDTFFASHDLREVLGGRAIDLAFIDGMHHFEFALRDFMHLEEYSHGATTILVHDCYPIDKETASRERSTQYWSGDVWKLALCLRNWRPDLRYNVIDSAPTGLGVISGLDPSSRVLHDNYDDVVSEVMDVPYEYLDENDKARVLNRVPGDWGTVRALLPQPFRSRPVHVLTVARAASAWRSKARGLPTVDSVSGLTHN
jgi:Methyltransferase domain